MNVPDTPLHSHLRRFARSQPHRPAYLWCGQAISHAELDATSDAFAARLSAPGVHAGDPVALFLGNWPQYVMAHRISNAVFPTHGLAAYDAGTDEYKPRRQ